METSFTMTSRIWVYDRMKNDSALALLTTPSGGQPQIFVSTTIKSVPKHKPFILYRQTSETQTFRGDDSEAVRSTGFMIFCHDEPGTYVQVDTLMGHLRRLFSDTNDPAANIVRSTWVDASEDLHDDDLGTITRYARIQVLYRI